MARHRDRAHRGAKGRQRHHHPKNRRSNRRCAPGLRRRTAYPGGRGAEGHVLRQAPVERVYVACGPTDLRKSIDGLSVLVSQAFDLDPFSPSLFVFCNRRRDKLKILHWDHNGFWLYYRRLEQDRFEWPSEAAGMTVTVSRRQLGWLLDGLPIHQARAHRPVTARTVI